MGYLDDKLTTCIGELYLISPPENWWLEFTESRAPDGFRDLVVGGSTESAEGCSYSLSLAQPKPPASWNTYRNAGWLEVHCRVGRREIFLSPVSITKNELL